MAMLTVKRALKREKNLSQRQRRNLPLKLLTLRLEAKKALIKKRK